MAAYLIGHITIKDPDAWQKYVDGVKTSLDPFGAKVLFRGERAAVLTGTHPYRHTVVIEFSDQQTLQSWYNSEKYQELIPIRDKAADVVIISYNT
jgi:uncharacterized protein (DUF1330 family)